jgi:hypothetical protein
MGLKPGSEGRNATCPYLAPEFDVIREWLGYAPERVVARWRRRSMVALRMGLGKHRPGTINYCNRLFFLMGVGNPFSTSHAHKFMVRNALRSRARFRKG